MLTSSYLPDPLNEVPQLPLHINTQGALVKAVHWHTPLPQGKMPPRHWAPNEARTSTVTASMPQVTPLSRLLLLSHLTPSWTRTQRNSNLLNSAACSICYKPAVHSGDKAQNSTHWWPSTNHLCFETNLKKCGVTVSFRLQPALFRYMMRF